MKHIELNEGLIDSIHDFLRSNGIMKTKWRGREIGPSGVGDLSEIKHIRLKISVENWLSDEAKDIFLF